MCGARGAPARARVERGRPRVERGRARVERGRARVERGRARMKRGPARLERGRPWSRPGPADEGRPPDAGPTGFPPLSTGAGRSATGSGRPSPSSPPGRGAAVGGPDHQACPARPALGGRPARRPGWIAGRSRCLRALPVPRAAGARDRSWRHRRAHGALRGRARAVPRPARARPCPRTRRWETRPDRVRGMRTTRRCRPPGRLLLPRWLRSGPAPGGCPPNRWPASAGTSPPEAPPRATRSYRPRRPPTRHPAARRRFPGVRPGRRSGPAAPTRMAPRGPARPGQRCPHAAIHRPIRALDDDSHSSNHFPCSS